MGIENHPGEFQWLSVFQQISALFPGMSTWILENPWGLFLMSPPGCVSPPMRKVFTVRLPTARCLRMMNLGRQIVFRFSRRGWTRVALHKQTSAEDGSYVSPNAPISKWRYVVPLIVSQAGDG